jgi:hypothetical protein
MPLFLRQLLLKKWVFWQLHFSSLKNLVAVKQQNLAGILICIGIIISQSFSSEGVGLEMSLFSVDLMWNDPNAKCKYCNYTIILLIIFKLMEWGGWEGVDFMKGVLSWHFSEVFLDISVWFWRFVEQKVWLLAENYKYFDSFANFRWILISKPSPFSGLFNYKLIFHNLRSP